MTRAKPKYDPWNWLLFTQLCEVLNAETEHERAMELADLISVALEDMDLRGFDPPQIYEKRMGEKSDDFLSIFAKYAGKYREVMEEIKKWPK